MGHKVYFFGDIHFSAMHPWLIDAGDKFIEWFMQSYKMTEHKNDYVIFLGDVTDKHVNPGGVIKQAFRLFEYCNKSFKKTFILTGNHDKKLYRDIAQSSLQFLECFDNVHVIEDIEKLEIENRTILAMPHLRTNIALSEYYNTFDWTSWAKENGICDVGIGHWSIKDPNFMFSKSGVEITQIPARKWVVGHIHTRPTPVYTGSIWPCNFTEQTCNYPRCIKEWDLTTNEWNETPLPIFLKFEEVNYPDAIEKEEDGPIKVFTVNGIKNKIEAEAYYSGVYIRDVNRNIINKELSDIAASDEIFLYKTNKEAFDAMIEESQMTVSENVYNIVSEIL